MAAASPGAAALGPAHEAAARLLTGRAAVAVLACLLVLAAWQAVSLAVLVQLLSLRTLLAVGGAVYVAAEAVFGILYIYRFMLLDYAPVRHRPLSHSPGHAFARAMRHLRRQRVDMRLLLSVWFHGTPFDSLRRDNVRDMLAYAFWFKTADEVAAEGRGAELERQVAFIEDSWDLRFPPGYDPRLRCMAHLWEPMRHWWRPAAFYVAMEGIALLCRVALAAAGFTRCRWSGLTFYTRGLPAQQQQQQPCHQQQQQQEQQQQQQQDEAPLVLLHGIGMGLVPYIGLLFNMAATGRPVLALELPHVSQRWVLWLPTVDELTEALVAVLDRSAVYDCCLVGHSYGTAVASRLLQKHPRRVRQLCLIDPVCFAMFTPTLLRNFLYEPPRSGSRLGDFLMLSAARDLHVSATLSRRFFWTDVNLWEEQLPPGSLIVLSGRDILMAAAEVKAWLQECTAAVVMYHPTLAHAGFLLDLQWQQAILQQLLPLLDSRSSAWPDADAAGGASGGGGSSSEGGSDVSPSGGTSVAGSAARSPAPPPAAKWLGSAGADAAAGRSASLAIDVSAVAAAPGMPLPAGAQLSPDAPVRAPPSRCFSSGRSTAAALGSARSTPEPPQMQQHRPQSSLGLPPNGVAAMLLGRTGSPGARSPTAGTEPLQPSSPISSSSSSSSSGASFASCAPEGPLQPAWVQGAAGDSGTPARLLSPFAAATAAAAAAGGMSHAASAVSLGHGSSLGLRPGASQASLSPWPPGSCEALNSLDAGCPPPPLCLRSWSGVGAFGGGAGGAAPPGCPGGPLLTPGGSLCSTLDSGLPESPRTFFSSASTMSVRSAAAAAAAAEAAHAARVLLQPLLAMQARKRTERQAQAQHAARGGGSLDLPAPAPACGALPLAAGAAAACVVERAPPTPPAAAPQPAAATRRVLPAAGSGGWGVLRRVEGLLQRRRSDSKAA